MGAGSRERTWRVSDVRMSVEQPSPSMAWHVSSSFIRSSHLHPICIHTSLQQSTQPTHHVRAVSSVGTILRVSAPHRLDTHQPKLTVLPFIVVRFAGVTAAVRSSPYQPQTPNPARLNLPAIFACLPPFMTDGTVYRWSSFRDK